MTPPHWTLEFGSQTLSTGTKQTDGQSMQRLKCRVYSDGIDDSDQIM
jgi:hypothetical protein